MLVSAGLALPRNPLKWHSSLHLVLGSLQRSPLFWVGLVLNTIGALGTGVVLAAGIFAGLPPATWGLLIIPVIDIGLTVVIRSAVFSAVQGEGRPPGD